MARRSDAQTASVLQVRNHDHADHAGNELPGRTPSDVRIAEAAELENAVILNSRVARLVCCRKTSDLVRSDSSDAA